MPSIWNIIRQHLWSIMLYVIKTAFMHYVQKLRHSKFRYIVWPIRSHELAKFLPMAVLMFTILLTQNIVRLMKDSLIVTQVGPEVISFIKLWLEAPAGIIFVIIYTTLCNKMTTERVFRIVVLAFLIFFVIFGFALFPYRDTLHPNHEIVNSLIVSYPHFKWFLTIWGKWSFVLFYVMVELWPVIVYALLYWQLANKITKTEEASRLYFFFLLGQANLLLSGGIVGYFASEANVLRWLFAGISDETEIMMKSLTITVTLCGAICLLLQKFIEYKFVRHLATKEQQNSKGTLSLSIKESIRMVLRSKYLGFICINVICCFTTINLIEGLWMSKVRELYSTTNAFMSYQGEVLKWTGVCTLLCAFMGSSIIRKFGWNASALLTPVVALIIGGLFFMSVFFEGKLDTTFAIVLCGASPLFFITFIGGLQNVLYKGAKYSLFDVTKEMVYIPLDDEMKTKGKAAVDIIGVKIGKSTGALMQFLIFTIFPNFTYQNIVPFLMIMFVCICVLWIINVKALGQAYSNILSQ